MEEEEDDEEDDDDEEEEEEPPMEGPFLQPLRSIFCILSDTSLIDILFDGSDAMTWGTNSGNHFLTYNSSA